MDTEKSGSYLLGAVKDFQLVIVAVCGFLSAAVVVGGELVAVVIIVTLSAMCFGVGAYYIYSSM